MAAHHLQLKERVNRRLPLLSCLMKPTVKQCMAMLVRTATFGNVYCARSNTGYRIVRPSEKSLRKKDSNLYEKRDCVTTVYRFATW